MSTPYLISKAIDPIFAVSMGIAAAAVRINREEKEKGKTTQQTVEALKRRTGLLFGNGTARIEEKTGWKGNWAL